MTFVCKLLDSTILVQPVIDYGRGGNIESNLAYKQTQRWKVHIDSSKNLIMTERVAIFKKYDESILDNCYMALKCYYKISSLKKICYK